MSKSKRMSTHQLNLFIFNGLSFYACNRATRRYITEKGITPQKKVVT